jgi:acetylornithine deacetylase/succinyl-diaminopimelate desuccinylase-like protein
MVEAGLEGVYRDRVGNVIGRRRGRQAAPAILLAAHLDTVFPLDTEIRVRRTVDTLHAPGIGDNSSSLGALIWMARILDLAAVKLERDIVFCATVGEEGLGDLRGMKEIMGIFGERSACVIPLDGSLGGLVHEAVGSRRFRLKVTAEGGHSWGAFGAPSAIHSLGRIVAQVSEIPVPRDPKTTFNIGVINGGTSVNTIAASAECLLDLRSVDPEELAKLENRVMAIVGQVAKDTVVHASVELLGDRPAGSIPPNHPLCLIVRAVHQHLGIVTKAYPSSTDANIPLSLGIPSVSLGVAAGANGHRLDEYIFTDPLDKGMQQLVLLLLALQRIPLSGGSAWRI